MLRGMFHRAFVVAAICLVSLPASAARRFRQGDVTDSLSCTVQGDGFRLGGEWSRSMMASSGKPCGGTFRATGRTMFKRLYLTANPKHGRVVLQQGGYYHYTSAAGYRGSDSFSLRVCGIGPSGAETCGNLHFSVTVE